jgi:hypothetical protein
MDGREKVREEARTVKKPLVVKSDCAALFIKRKAQFLGAW